MREHRERGFPASIVAFSMVFGPNNILPDREQRMFIRLARGRKVLIPGTGTTVGQIGHVDDEARALRMMMMNTNTFGKRYNLTGGDLYTDLGYVDTFARVVGVEAEKVFLPHELMDDLWNGRVRTGGAPMKAHINIRSSTRDSQAHFHQLQRLLQRIAPHLHHWDRNVFFSIDRLKQDIGWEPEYCFEGAVQQTWDWMVAEGLHESLDFDYSFEDDLLERLGAPDKTRS